jgi:hypothetical protein
MAVASIIRHGPRGHLRAIRLAVAASVLVGVTSGWAQSLPPGPGLPFCPVYPDGAAPAIGPSNCLPPPQALWGPAIPSHAPAAVAAPASTATLFRPSADGAHPAAPPLAVTEAVAPKAPGLGTVISLRTPGAATLDQIAASLGPVSQRAVTFALSSADEYKESDLTHRVRLTWSGPLRGLVDQLAQIYGLDVAVDDTAIRFSSRPSDRDRGAPTSRAP